MTNSDGALDLDEARIGAQRVESRHGGRPAIILGKAPLFWTVDGQTRKSSIGVRDHGMVIRAARRNLGRSTVFLKKAGVNNPKRRGLPDETVEVGLTRNRVKHAERRVSSEREA